MAMGMTMMITIIMFTDINARLLLWRGIHADHRGPTQRKNKTQHNITHTAESQIHDTRDKGDFLFELFVWCLV